MNTTRFENADAAAHAAIIMTELVDHYLPRMAELGCEGGVTAAMLIVEDPRSDYEPARFAPFSLDEAEVLAVYRASKAGASAVVETVESPAEQVESVQAPSAREILSMVRVIKRSLPFSCEHPAALHARLREEVIARTHRPLGASSDDEAAYWRALDYVVIEVRDGLAVQVRPPREVTRGGECFEVLPVALAAISGASALVAAGAAALYARAAREERAAEEDLARLRAELDELRGRS